MDLFKELEKDDVFYDVSAYTGLFTGAVASMLPPNHVVAFEPGDGVSELRAFLNELGVEAYVVKKAVNQKERGKGNP